MRGRERRKWREGGCGDWNRQDEGGVGAHLVNVDVGCVEEDVVLATETGEYSSNAGHQL